MHPETTPNFWQKDFVCKYCKTEFKVSVDNVIYGDLRQPFFFVPDWQYYTVCPNELCKENLIVEDIPSHVAVWIQTGLHTPK